MYLGLLGVILAIYGAAPIFLYTLKVCASIVCGTRSIELPCLTYLIAHALVTKESHYNLRRKISYFTNCD